MEIGKTQRIYTIEPIEDPVPRARPDEVDKPTESQPVLSDEKRAYSGV